MKIQSIITNDTFTTEEKINQIQELISGGALNIYGEPLTINDYNMSQYTPLGAAFEFGDLALIRFLISIGADINATGNKISESLLHIALRNNHTHLIKFLINEMGMRADAPIKIWAGDSLRGPINTGDTVLRGASIRGDLEVFNLLLESMDYSLEQIEKIRDEILSLSQGRVLEDANSITAGLREAMDSNDWSLQQPALEKRDEFARNNALEFYEYGLLTPEVENLSYILNILNDLIVDLKKHNFSQLSEYRSAGVERFAMTLDEFDIAEDLIDNVIMLYYDENNPKYLNAQSISMEVTKAANGSDFSSSSESMSLIIAHTEETLIDSINSEDDAMNVAIILSRQAMTDEVIIQPLTLQYSSYSSSSSSSSNINSTELNLDNNTSSSSGYVLDSKAEVNETKPSKEELREIHNRKFKK